MVSYILAWRTRRLDASSVGSLEAAGQTVDADPRSLTVSRTTFNTSDVGFPAGGGPVTPPLVKVGPFPEGSLPMRVTVCYTATPRAFFERATI